MATPPMETDPESSLHSSTGHLSSAITVDRSQWHAQALASIPGLADVEERLLPLERAITFARAYQTEQRHVRKLRNDNVMRLILQHLEYEGLRQSAQVLGKEARVSYESMGLDDESRLMTLFSVALSNTEQLWNLTTSDREVAEEQQLQEIEAQLFTLGILDEDQDDGIDVNIWDEDEESNIVYTERGDGVKAASLNQLVARLTAANNVDMDFTKTFLMTYQSFTTPEKFFAKLLQRYNVPPKTRGPDMTEEAWKSAVVMPIILRVCNVLRQWLSNYFEDIAQNETVLHRVRNFIEGTLRFDGHVNLSHTLSNLLGRKLDPTTAKLKKKFKPSEPPPDPKLNLKRLFSPTLTIDEVDEEEVARQLTLVTFATYKAIQPSELLNLNWTKPKTRHRSPNVMKMITGFNEVSQWVAAAILSKETLRSRTRMYQRFIKIAEHLRLLNNFNGLMSIISGLNNAAVNRLKFTLEELPASSKAVLESLESDVDHKNAYATYRRILANTDPPLIPYLGTYLTDLTFMEEGSKNHINDLINFFKRQLVYDVISKVQQYQLTEYNLQPVVQIQALLSRLPRKDDDDLYSCSLRMEPRKAERSAIK